MGLLAQTTDGGGGSTIFWLFYVVFVVAYIVAWWVVFTKAGEAGWKSLIPIYNIYILLKIVGRPGWWLILLLIPIVNFIIWIIVALDLAKSFGKGTGFAIGLILLAPIFFLILAFGDATYRGGAGAQGGTAPPSMPPAPA
ncbi:MAG: DUF5684 domain-containing protein [Actinomycetota bacterium]|nr:DUF5684 domain-containing protein [Actinomycetota bacterium]MDH5223515.1 DUF5684 domain-containing protein [Actinomycetota bacterium]MDH5313533.1 DUF5684 domain-containing protein [Actinomycetota bacterium]